MKPEHITDLDWQLLKQKYPNNIKDILTKLNNHYPVQYLIGNVEFLNTIIKVDERALIPRFETELLVNKTITRLKKLKNPKILDLGCGSGCISIALKKNIPCQVTSVDISEKAIQLAQENAQNNQVQIEFINKSMFDINYDNYDVIISNPPYVSYNEEVGKEIKYEPEIAIYAQNNGLYYYQKILLKINNQKIKPNLIAFEIGAEQKEEITKLIEKYLSNYNYTFEKDLANKDRYLFITKNE